MHDESRKRLTGYLGECWHEWENSFHDPNRKVESVPNCKKCESIRKWDGSTENHTFTTYSDLGALKDKLVENGEWDSFEDYAWKKWHKLPPKEMTNFAAWLFRPESCELVDEYLKSKEA